MDKEEIAQINRIIEEGDALTLNKKITAGEINLHYREELAELLFWARLKKENTQWD